MLVEELLEYRAHGGVDLGAQLRIVQPVLGLALELGFMDEHRKHGYQPFPDIVRGQGQASRQKVVRLDVVPHRFAEPIFEALLVGAAVSSRYRVDVRPHMFPGSLGPLQRQLEAESVVSLENERRRMHRPEVVALQQRLDEILQPAVVPKFRGGTGHIVAEHDPQAFVEEGLDLEALRDEVRGETRVVENGRIRGERDGGSGAPTGSDRFDRAERLAPPVFLDPLGPISTHAGLEARGQRIHHGCAHPMEPAGRGIRLGVELPAGMQLGEDHLERGTPVFRVLVHRDAPAVVGDGEGRTVLVQVDGDE